MHYILLTSITRLSSINDQPIIIREGSSDEKIRKQKNVKILFSHHGDDVLTGNSCLDVNSITFVFPSPTRERESIIIDELENPQI